MTVSSSRIYRFALIAGLSALIGWIAVEPINRAQERVRTDIIRRVIHDIFSDATDLTRPDTSQKPGDVIGTMRKVMDRTGKINKQISDELRKSAGNPYLNTALIITIVGMMLGTGLALADELDSLSAKRVGFRALVGAGVGAVGGFIAGIVGNFVYSSIIPGGLGMLPFMVVIARAIAWAIAGMTIGVSIGAANGSKKLAVLGMVGGCIGGGIGGMFFDLLSGIGATTDIFQTTGYHYATTGRLFAGAVMGVCIGAAVAYIQEQVKQAWVTVLVGRNEGKNYILTKPTTVIGRDELADIPLFGDHTIDKRHAAIQEQSDEYFLSTSSAAAVNNVPVTQTHLKSGDMITIGKFTLRFTTRMGQSPVNPIPQQAYAQTQINQPQINAQSYTPGTPVVPKLRAVGGLLNGAVFDITACKVTIGREPSNDIALSQDTSVSRRHAEISYENGRYIVRDIGSTNGVYINGNRVTEADLNPTDVLHIGDTQFRLTFEPPLV